MEKVLNLCFCTSAVAFLFAPSLESNCESKLKYLVKTVGISLFRDKGAMVKSRTRDLNATFLGLVEKIEKSQKFD